MDDPLSFPIPDEAWKPITPEQLDAALRVLGVALGTPVSGRITGRWNDMLALPTEREN